MRRTSRSLRNLSLLQLLINRLPRRKIPRPQLLMWFSGSLETVPLADATGYTRRGLTDGDEAGWYQLLAVNGELGHWDPERARAQLYPDLVRSTQTFVVQGKQLVACAGMYDRVMLGIPAWEVGWVAVHPEHQHRCLGRQAAAGALRAAGQLPVRPVYLRTDAFRIPAIRTYLKLGFVPDCSRFGDVRRWQSVLRLLPEPYAELADRLPEA